ncbi:MAG: CHASE2 domain-containing protein, partial [Aquabacterium sp.]
VVDIDEASLDAVGPWPWPRATMARLARQLDAAGAVVQAYDMVLDAPREGDDELAEAWRKLPVVGGQIFSLDPTVVPRVGRPAGSMEGAGCPDSAPASHGVVANNAIIAAATSVVGHLTPVVEIDGVVRKVPAVVCHDGRAYPSLALAVLWRASQGSGSAGLGPDWQPSSVPVRGLGGLHADTLWTSTALPGVTVPVDSRGHMRVPYRVSRSAISSVPAAQVLNGTVDTSPLKGAIVLVGATAFGIGDTTATPLARVASGVEVHAQSLVGLLDGTVPYTPVRAAAVQGVAAALSVALLLAIAVRRQGAPVKRLPIAGAALAMMMALGAAFALVGADLWLPWTLPALFILLASSALATAEHAITRVQRERLSAHLGSYLPAPVAERLATIDPSGSIQVDHRHVTVLVADIRNFSARAIHRPPQETAVLLHAFYCLAVDVVEQHGGVIENVVGDSVLAVWNAYSDSTGHEELAAAAACELVRATRVLWGGGPALNDDATVQPLALGVGLEAGTAIVGSFGPARRRAHVALGEPVSVASRLQQMTQDLSIPVLMGPKLASKLDPGRTEALGNYLLEGMSAPVTIFAPADWADLVPTEHLWASLGKSTQDGVDSSDAWSPIRDAGLTSGLSSAIPRTA